MPILSDAAQHDFYVFSRQFSVFPAEKPQASREIPVTPGGSSPTFFVNLLCLRFKFIVFFFHNVLKPTQELRRELDTSGPERTDGMTEGTQGAERTE